MIFTLFLIHKHNTSYKWTSFNAPTSLPKVSKYVGKSPQGSKAFLFKQKLYFIPFLHCGSQRPDAKERNFNLENMNSHASSTFFTQPTYEIHRFSDGTKQALQIWKLNCMNFTWMHIFSVWKTNILVSRRWFGKWNAKKALHILTLQVWSNGTFFLTFATL